ncbi:EF-hand domain-containing protein [Actinomadura terrae]|uniref:EF-hand domain-containing protein n=1 Tax=Actinomadura terrae TaxID=604353 RepID=UPI001FA75B9E|nr:EF-hand domain-containing protein [Actinomadura terrae]
MSTTAQVKKFTTLFQWIDQNGDGWLTLGDFEQMAELFVALASPDDEENKSAIKHAFMAWWDLLREDGDKHPDEEVGRKEFIGTMLASVTAPANFDRIIMGIVNSLMSALDVNRDGVLSEDEYVRMYDALGIDPRTSGEAFRRLDRDGDGTISHDEFRTAISEFYLSPDEDAPGNWLLGSPQNA